MKLKRSIKTYSLCAISVVFSLSIIVVANCFFIHEDKSYADQVTVNSYSEAKAYLANVNAEHDAILQKATEIYNKIEETTAQVFEVQNQLVKKQCQVNEILKYQYINNVQFSIIYSIVESESFEEFLKTMEYANSTMTYQYRLSSELKSQKVFYEKSLNELNKQVEEQNKYLAQANEKVVQANQALDSVRGKLNPAELEELEGIKQEISGEGQGDAPAPVPSPEPTPGPNPGPQPDPGPS